MIPSEDIPIKHKIPIFNAWLRNKNGLGAYLEFFNEQNERRSFLNYNFIRQLISEHRSNKSDNTEYLWTIINLELWLRIFIDGIAPDNVLKDSLYE